MKKSDFSQPLLLLSFLFLSFLSNGQSALMKVDVKRKPPMEYVSYDTRTMSQLPNFKVSKPITTNIYGSRLDRKTKATGFFHAELIKGRWWVVDPKGYLMIVRAVNEIEMGGGAVSKMAFASKYKNNDTVWMSMTKQYLKEMGFNCAGSWSNVQVITSNPSQQTAPLAYTKILNWMSGYGATRIYQQSGHKGYPNDAIFVFEKGFEEFCDIKAKELIANKEDVNLFGYFTDNELPFFSRSLAMFLRLGKSDAANPNYLATKQWLADNNFSEADTLNSEVKSKFVGYIGEVYSRTVNNALKKYDPNHMNFGPRIYVKETLNNPYFMKAMGKNVDILAVNYYNAWSPDSTFMTNWGKNLNKPFMVTEFYTKASDAGLANTSGAGWIVKTQLDRGYAYQNFTLGLLESHYCVGWHWFKYMDNDPSVPSDPSNTDANKGIVKIDYEPYTPMVDQMKEINLNVYNLIDYFDRK